MLRFARLTAALTIAGIVATTGTMFSPWMVLGILAIASSVLISFSAKELTWVRVIATGCVVIALLHLRVHAFLGESAIIAGVVMVAVTISGVVRAVDNVRGCRPRSVVSCGDGGWCASGQEQSGAR